MESQGVTLEGFKKGKSEIFVKTSAHEGIIRFPIVQYDIIKRFIIRLRDSKQLLNSKYVTLRFMSYRCAICLEKLEEKDYCRDLPCLHSYHLKCLDKWFEFD